jgi:hypothetical protein
VPQRAGCLTVHAHTDVEGLCSPCSIRQRLGALVGDGASRLSPTVGGRHWIIGSRIQYKPRWSQIKFPASSESLPRCSIAGFVMRSVATRPISCLTESIANGLNIVDKTSCWIDGKLPMRPLTCLGFDGLVAVGSPGHLRRRRAVEPHDKLTGRLVGR